MSAGFAVEQYEVQSESSNRKYIVSKMQSFKPANGVSGIVGTAEPVFSWQCSCKGWTMHTPRRDCKHIDYIKHFGGSPVEPMLMAMRKAVRKAEKEKVAA